MKNLSKQMSSTGLITPQRKFQPSPMKGKSLYSIVKYEALVPNALSNPIAVVLKH